jgi:Arc/MetJ-type ribon-helix-helix transcriptional regulator
MAIRKTMNISVQDDLYAYIRERSQTSYYGSVSEYIRYLVRCDREGRIETDKKKDVRTRLRTANERMFMGMFEDFLDSYFKKKEEGQDL